MLNRLYIYIYSDFFWWQDIILQLIIDLVRIVVILSIEKIIIIKFPCAGDVRERA